MPEDSGSVTPKEKYQSAILSWLGWAMVLILWCFTAFAWFRLPDTIPIHFDAGGNVDGYGSRTTILLFPVIASVLFLGLSFLCRYPGIYNYPVPITDENRQFQYRNAVHFMQFLNFSVVLIFTLVTLITYRAGIGAITDEPAWLLPLILCLVVLPTIFTMVRAFRKK